MFEWDWASVASECTNFLGPAGYGFVQGTVKSMFASKPRFVDATTPLVSPAQEHVQGSEWWTDYQPVSYILTSKRGDQAQYKTMIDTCHAAGVKVIAGQSKGERERADGRLFADTVVCVQIRYGTI